MVSLSSKRCQYCFMDYFSIRKGFSAPVRSHSKFIMKLKTCSQKAGAGGEERASPVLLTWLPWEDTCLNHLTQKPSLLLPVTISFLQKEKVSYRNGVYFSKMNRNSLYDSLVDMAQVILRWTKRCMSIKRRQGGDPTSVECSGDAVSSTLVFQCLCPCQEKLQRDYEKATRMSTDLKNILHRPSRKFNPFILSKHSKSGTS